MFGPHIDYLLLRPFTHKNNIRTEEELDASVSQRQSLVLEDASARVKKLISRLEDNFPISDALRYLDIGCGTGDITIALAKAGCKNITGIDSVPRRIAQAKQYAKMSQIEGGVEFICQDIHDWIPPHQYDVIILHESLEHISKPKMFLQKAANMLALNGVLVLAFGPLFHSPIGDHMGQFFKMPIPWRGAIFSEKAVLRLRQECYRPTDNCDKYQNINGGLNLMRYSEFLQYVGATGWKLDFIRVNPQLKRFPPVYILSNILTQIPFVKDYFASSIYSILRRRAL